MISLINIDVCIATFRRPLMLSRLLSSLADQDLKGINMRIIVVDNDFQQSARPAIESFSEKNSFAVIYEVEPMQNIAMARNHALRLVSAEYFAFVDDDEVVSPTWLHTLLSSLNTYHADVAFGPVISVLPIGSPGWAKKIFHRQHPKTGEPVMFGGAGNVMMKKSILIEMPQYFDSSFGLTGGEDTEFFYRLHLKGKHLIWCAEARVDEYVPETRVSLKWLRRRGFRSGQTYNRIIVSRYSFPQKIVWFLLKIFQFSIGIAVAPFLRLCSFPAYIALTVRIAASAGQLSRCFSEKNFEEYNT